MSNIAVILLLKIAYFAVVFGTNDDLKKAEKSTIYEADTIDNWMDEWLELKRNMGENVTETEQTNRANKNVAQEVRHIAANGNKSLPQYSKQVSQTANTVSQQHSMVQTKHINFEVVPQPNESATQTFTTNFGSIQSHQFTQHASPNIAQQPQHPQHISQLFGANFEPPQHSPFTQQVAPNVWQHQQDVVPNYVYQPTTMYPVAHPFGAVQHSQQVAPNHLPQHVFATNHQQQPQFIAPNQIHLSTNYGQQHPFQTAQHSINVLPNVPHVAPNHLSSNNMTQYPQHFISNDAPQYSQHFPPNYLRSGQPRYNGQPMQPIPSIHVPQHLLTVETQQNVGTQQMLEQHNHVVPSTQTSSLSNVVRQVSAMNIAQTSDKDKVCVSQQGETNVESHVNQQKDAGQHDKISQNEAMGNIFEFFAQQTTETDDSQPVSHISQTTSANSIAQPATNLSPQLSSTQYVVSASDVEPNATKSDCIATKNKHKTIKNVGQMEQFVVQPIRTGYFASVSDSNTTTENRRNAKKKVAQPPVSPPGSLESVSVPQLIATNSRRSATKPVAQPSVPREFPDDIDEYVENIVKKAIYASFIVAQQHPEKFGITKTAGNAIIWPDKMAKDLCDSFVAQLDGQQFSHRYKLELRLLSNFEEELRKLVDGNRLKGKWTLISEIVEEIKAETKSFDRKLMQAKVCGTKNIAIGQELKVQIVYMRLYRKLGSLIVTHGDATRQEQQTLVDWLYKMSNKIALKLVTNAKKHQFSQASSWATNLVHLEYTLDLVDLAIMLSISREEQKLFMGQPTQFNYDIEEGYFMAQFNKSWSNPWSVQKNSLPKIREITGRNVVNKIAINLGLIFRRYITKLADQRAKISPPNNMVVFLHVYKKLREELVQFDLAKLDIAELKSVLRRRTNALDHLDQCLKLLRKGIRMKRGKTTPKHPTNRANV